MSRPFRCERLACSLSVVACAERYRKTLKLFAHSSRSNGLNTHPLIVCKDCSVGAQNAANEAV